MSSVDFFIIGAQKSGTTSIHNYLKKQKNIYLPDTKELQIFSIEKLFSRKEEYLDAYYGEKSSKVKKGLSDVRLLYYSKRCAPRLYKHNSDARLIISLRNPIDRAYSSYWFTKMKGFEDAETFEEAIDEEEIRFESLDEDELIAQTYLNVGKYFEQVKMYIDLFGIENVKVMIFEEFIADKKKYLKETLDFIQEDVSEIDYSVLDEKHNSSSTYKFRFINRFLKYKDKIPWIDNFFSANTKKLVRENILNKIIDFNKKQFSYPDMNEETHKSLESFYYEDVNKLSNLLDKDLFKTWNLSR